MGVLFKGQGALFSQLWQVESFVLVFLGTMAATVLQFPLQQCRLVLRWVWVAFKPRRQVFLNDVSWLVDVAAKTNQHGVDALIQAVETSKNPFIKKMLGLVVDGASESMVQRTGEQTIQAIKDRHEVGIFFFEQMAKYAPGFGLLGTVVGLIQLLSSLTTPNQLGQGMALALVTTFYGILLANLVFQPIAGRLVVLDQEEARHNEMMLLGILGLVQGMHPLLIKEKMEILVHNQQVVLA